MNYEDLMKLGGCWMMKWWNPQPAAGSYECHLQGGCQLCAGAGTCPHSWLPVAVWPLEQCGQCAHHRGMVPVPATRTHHTCHTFRLSSGRDKVWCDVQCTLMHDFSINGCRMFWYVLIVFIYLNVIYIKYLCVLILEIIFFLLFMLA